MLNYKRTFERETLLVAIVAPRWASRSLAAARAILLAQLINDPGGQRGWYSGKSKEQADRERNEIFDLIIELVKWKNLNNFELISLK